MSLHKCPRCGNEVVTNSKIAGAFELPPILHCVHKGEVVEMELADQLDFNEDLIVKE